MTVVVRKSVPLSDEDLERLNRLRASQTRRECLAALNHEPVAESVSDAALIQALMQAGMSAVDEQLELAGYLQLADERQEPERRAVARRRKPDWAAEQ